MDQVKKYPQVAVKIVFLWEGRILMFRHADGTYDLPGGTMEWGEAILETLRRELREELAYDLVGEPELLSVYNSLSPDREKHKVLIQYLQELSQEPELHSLEGVAFFWLNRHQAQLIFSDAALLDKIFCRETRAVSE